MPRPKKPKLYTLVPGSSPGAHTELWTHIDDVLTFANKHASDAWRKSEDSYRSLGESIFHVLTSFAVGGSGQFEGWPGWAATGILNIHRLIRKGGYYLRRCRECELWFLAHDKRRRRCGRPACLARVAQMKSRAARQRELERQRVAKRTLRILP
jgi:hypothetical protein